MKQLREGYGMQINPTLCRRTFHVTLIGIFLIIFCASAYAQTLPEDAPILISLPGSTRAYATLPGQPNSPVKVSGYGRRGVITLYLTNLDLMKGEGANAFRADVEDSRRYRFALSIVSLERTRERKWVYALTVRLHEEIGDAGDVLVRVTWRGMSSNRVRLSIGHESAGIKDDEGAVPTPMPDKPPVHQQTEAVTLPYKGDIVRFMEQAAFGPSSSLEQRLRRTGLSVWIGNQLNDPELIDYECNPDPPNANCPAIWPIGTYPNLRLQPTNIDPNCNAVCQRDRYSMYPLQNWFFREALYNENQQLRRRVSWALGQIFVVSGRETVQPGRMLTHIKILDKYAFGNFRELLHDMTLNPVMGNYLDMALSTRANPNENYAREILQLFSIGVFMLNQDGTLMLDGNGNRIPTYDQSVVNGFSKVFTGWTFCNSGCPNSQLNAVNYRDPMILIPANHDPGEKKILSYQPGGVNTIPAGQSAEQDLNQALDNIFYHPNVGPFIGKLLIQQLVTSNPTPAYVSRVAAAFNRNEYGFRGDMKAVIRAILLDPEARGNIKTDPNYGHLREPVLYVTNVLRSLGASAQSDAPAICVGLSDGVINGVTSPLDQDVFNPPSVFNYYPMDYQAPNSNLLGPEFGIFSTGTALKRPNFTNQMLFGSGNTNGITVNPEQNVICGTRVNISYYQSLANADQTGALLVDTLNREIMHGTISAATRNEIMTAVQAVTVNDGGLKRARTAIYLVLNTPQYQVQR